MFYWLSKDNGLVGNGWYLEKYDIRRWNEWACPGAGATLMIVIVALVLIRRLLNRLAIVAYYDMGRSR